MLDSIYALSASPEFAHDGICFAARQSGLFRSADGGATWSLATGGSNRDESPPVTAVAVSPTFTSDHSVFAGGSGGILLSTDSGQRWTAVSFPAPPPLVTVLAISPNFLHDGILFAGTLEDGILRSADRGTTWTPWNFGLLDLNVLSLAIAPSFADDETIFAGTAAGVFRSTNGGRAWRDVAFPMSAAPVVSLAISPAYGTDGVLFAGTEANGLFISVDRGQDWDCRGEVLKGQAINSVILSPHFPTRSQLLVALEHQLLVSRDGGVSWLPRTPEALLGEGIAAIIAPRGIGKSVRLLVGLVDGSIISV